MEIRRIVLAPDSFKGTMSAREVCQVEKQALLEVFPQAHITCLPMADGGEGLTDTCLGLLGGERVAVRVTGPRHTPVEAFYARLPDGSAVIEMAAAAGLPLMNGRLDPLTATTQGVGELILHAAHRGARRILLGLGGSATNDGGVGMAYALGWRFYDGAGCPVAPLAGNLSQIEDIRLEAPLPELEVLAACDVDNPLCGETGATAVFGPQKGVTPQTRPILEAGLAHLAARMEAAGGSPLAGLPGAGAAGGLGAGVCFFLGGSLHPGVELVLEAAEFDALAAGADLVITGEGRMDGQSARGKVPSGVARRCAAAGVPCVALCGGLGEGARVMYDLGVTAMFSTLHGFTTPEAAAGTCRADLADLTRAVARLLAAL